MAWRSEADRVRVLSALHADEQCECAGDLSVCPAEAKYQAELAARGAQEPRRSQ